MTSQRMDAFDYGVAPPGYRLPPATRPGRVRLQVADLERSLAWYGDVLGLRVLERSAGAATLGPADAAAPGTATAGPAQAGRAVVELRERPGAAAVPARGRLGLYHYAILLPTRAALGAFVRHLTEVREPAGGSDHLVSEALYLRDPDGLGIEVYADRPRESWRHRERQLVMATERLDADDLVRAAGGAAWTGMPAGTTIGHVHLHVGDLDAAAAFYHEALGLDKVVWSYPGALFLSAGGYHHHLGLNTWAGGAAPAGDEDAKLLEWELLLPSADDVARAGASIEAAGHEVERRDGDVVASDPWGTRLRLSVAGASAMSAGGQP